ncbi:VWA domain-containing protein [Verrucomicrobiaceae bacterium 5K15]|uniref:VWA domain-containing protein n=1 Tax=Oceaniferula flava TaxID=2800421 RepID=A0AAE2V7C9_9BACT|nr:VWA domain-containing protein [Oceaniferula flavus]MBK1853512.1 VWA domain-containing protein [Oceaniferula flavus]MBM1134817.1 VWA domain-containing protein [Oceaniferula flavus]
MSYLHPGLLLLQLILPFILLGAILAARKQGQAWKRMVAPRLQSHLVKKSSPTRRWVALGLGLLGCGFLITALARPYHGETTTTEQISTRNILIAIDTSRSMLVKDGSPDRMATAKAMAIEVINAFPNDRIGVIAFSGAPVLMAPLTIDHAAVHETISQLDTNVIPSGGSDISAAVDTAVKAFKKTGQKSNALILISDGEDHSQKIDLAAEKIRSSKTVVCAIGVGTTAGGVVPSAEYRDGKYRDSQGQTVFSQMTPEALQTLARAGRGEFTPASSGSTKAIAAALDSLQREEQAGRETTVPKELFQWFLIPAILLLALSIVVRSEFLSGGKRQTKKSTPQPPPIKSATALLLFALCLPLPAANVIEQAEDFYNRKDYRQALKLFSKALPNTSGEDRRAIQFSIGSSAYKLKDWQTANDYLSSALLTENPKLQEQVHYNLGNALFMTGWSQFKPVENPEQDATDDKESYHVEDLDAAITAVEDSIDHFQATLALNLNHANAATNLEAAQKLLDELKNQQQQEQEKQQQQQNQQQQGEQDPKEKEGEKEQSDQGEKPDDQPGDGNQEKPDDKGNEGEQGENGEQQEGDQGEQSDDKDPNEQGEGEQGDRESQQPPSGEQPDPKDMERQEGESEEAYAARVLKDNSDAETRPVQRRLLRLRRPAKDW